MADGHLNKCKECTKLDVHLHRYDPRYRAGVLTYDRNRFHESLERRAYSYAKSREHTADHPDRTKARAAVRNAIRGGRLTRLPCRVCGAARAEAHHPDYSKPLEVEWLCKAHHELIHAGILIA